jgi:hypothetical protein
MQSQAWNTFWKACVGAAMAYVVATLAFLLYVNFR